VLPELQVFWDVTERCLVFPDVSVDRGALKFMFKNTHQITAHHVGYRVIKAITMKHHFPGT
jgi:hypothetical protein